jgi:hypothetical protein
MLFVFNNKNGIQIAWGSGGSVTEAEPRLRSLTSVAEQSA